ncbi:transposase [Chryseobacterium sp.]|uniref:transposase n=1 Tax=Chryseobacterium sp. TaxID=1871047 RepID=UPI0035AF7AF8
MDYLKNIHIGELIEARWKWTGISMERTCNFFKVTEAEIQQIFRQNDMSSECLLRWSKLLEYDFFRLYSQHLVLYSPLGKDSRKAKQENSSDVPVFRKNLYTQEIILFVLEQVKTGEKTKRQIMDEYRIPKTTLYKWLEKYKEKV